ncbi:MAG: cupredoxin domain-containing protein [Bryobacteraceae bacterium]|nr:cupredoxin domain-containing protein [Bryobacteraceae bacterium]
MLEILILLAGIAAVALVNWYFFMAPRTAVAAATSAAGRQEVTIRVEGGYTPSVIRAKRGKPLRLIFDRREKSPCSDEIVISEFGVRRFLKPFEKTVIDVTPAQAGAFEFTCGMSMLRGQIQVEG